MRQVTKKEWEEYEWIDVTAYGSNDIEVIPGFKKNDPPPMPNDGLMYKLVEVTKMADRQRRWEWKPIFRADID